MLCAGALAARNRSVASRSLPPTATLPRSAISSCDSWRGSVDATHTDMLRTCRAPPISTSSLRQMDTLNSEPSGLEGEGEGVGSRTVARGMVVIGARAGERRGEWLGDCAGERRGEREMERE